MPPAKVELTVVDTSSEAHDWGGVFPLNNVVSGLHWFDRIYFEGVYLPEIRTSFSATRRNPLRAFNQKELCHPPAVVKRHVSLEVATLEGAV